MKAKLILALVLSLVLVLFVAGNVFAIKIVSYDDTAAEIDKEYGESGAGSLICNGNFDEWDSGFPVCWEYYEVPKAGWEEDHLANVNLAEIGDTAVEVPFNDGLGLFVRNIGGSGPHFVYSYNELTNVTASGYYWVEVQASMWGYYQQIMYADWIFGYPMDSDATKLPYNALITEDGIALNSQAFYGIGHTAAVTATASPDDVTEWRELFPLAYGTYNIDGDGETLYWADGSTVVGEGWEWHNMDADKWVPGVVPCANAWEACFIMGRMETIWIDADSTPYFWLKAGQKFDTFNVWTVFMFDDVLVMEAADSEYDGSQLEADGAVGWDQDELR